MKLTKEIEFEKCPICGGDFNLEGTEVDISTRKIKCIHHPCINCSEPVIFASVGGDILCPKCDCGFMPVSAPLSFFKRERKEKIINFHRTSGTKCKCIEYLKL